MAPLLLETHADPRVASFHVGLMESTRSPGSLASAFYVIVFGSNDVGNGAHLP